MKEAIFRFQANARGELLPADGPVKVAYDGDETLQDELLAKALEDDFNHYLTTVATEYYPDTDKQLLATGFRGCSFKKVYHCPIRRRPVSESIDPENLIVSNAATDLKSCRRVTHRIMMRPSVVKRMQLLKRYRDVYLSDPIPTVPNAVDQKKAEVQGITHSASMDPKDLDREIFECYSEYDLPGYEHKEKGESTGLQLPWKVTIDKSSREVLEVTRDWDSDDDQCLARTTFVKYPFVPGFGFYDIGLLQILGDVTLAATSGWREMLDAGAFSCFPGFLYPKQLGKQLTNEFRVPPGGGMPIDLGGATDIRTAIMPLPYSPPNSAMMALIQDVVQTGQRVGGTSELPVGEGKQDAPVGTTLALIEQATKVMSAVHKRLHQAQSEEFQLLRERFMEDPEALWRHNKKSKFLELMIAQEGQVDPSVKATEEEEAQATEKRKERFLLALENFQIVPRADPNTASQMQRIMKASALIQVTMGDPAWDQVAIKSRAMQMIGIDDIDALKAQAPPQQQPDLKGQAAMLTAQAADKKASASLADSQTKAKSAELDNMTEAQEAKSKETVAMVGLAREKVIHQDDMANTRLKLQQDAQQQNADRNSATQQANAALASETAQQNADRAADLHKHRIDTQTDMMKHHVDTQSDLAQAQQQADVQRETHQGRVE